VDKFNHRVGKIEGVLEEECSNMLTDFFKGLRQRLKTEKENNED
jgi:tRNA(adenine34) deaminase